MTIYEESCVTQGRVYDTCIPLADGKNYCSISVDADGNTLDDSMMECKSDCDVTFCPVGFYRLVGAYFIPLNIVSIGSLDLCGLFNLVCLIRAGRERTCYQVSAPIPGDAMATVADAENQCAMQGGRLWQPRSVESYLTAFPQMETLHMGKYTANPLSNHFHENAFGDGITAIGLTYINETLRYRDSEPVPQELLDVLEWEVGYPNTTNTSHVCVVWWGMKMRNVACEGNKFILSNQVELVIKRSS